MSRGIVLALSTIFAVRGGIPRFNQMLCLALDRLAPELGLTVKVLSKDDSLEHYREHGSPWKHAEFIPCSGKLGITGRALSLCVRERPELMIIGLLGMTPLGVVCRPFLGSGFGFVAHGYECWEELDLARPKRSRRWTARRSGFVFSVSNYTRESLARSVGIPLDIIRLLPNTLDPEFQALPEGRSGSGPPEILTVSRLWVEDPMKGVDHTLRAFARIRERHPQVVYRIVGKGSDKPRLVELARELGLAPSVVFEEDLTDAELAERYRRASIFALPSGQEGFGIVFLEAMRFSRPCIGGLEGGTPDVIDHDTTGLLVPYGDEAQLARALERLLSDPGLREKMGRAGRERLEREFVFERFQARVARHVRDLLGDA